MTAPAEEGAAEERSPDERIKMTVSERSIGALTTALLDWLADRLGRPGQLTVSGVRTPGSGGLSSTSALFEASWISQGTRQGGAYVARMAPEDSAVPVFPRYDLAAQFEVIGQVAARCSVPLPKLRWNEPEGGPLGTPFFVMDQVDGRIPLDNPPYVFTGWLLEATPSERALLQRASIAVLAGLHAIAEPSAAFPDVEQCYQELSGYSPQDMDFYLTYAAVRHAIVMARIKRRMIHFGEDQVPDDPDDYVLHRPSLEKLLAGSYRWD